MPWGLFEDAFPWRTLFEHARRHRIFGEASRDTAVEKKAPKTDAIITLSLGELATRNANIFEVGWTGLFEVFRGPLFGPYTFSQIHHHSFFQGQANIFGGWDVSN